MFYCASPHQTLLGVRLLVRLKMRDCQTTDWDLSDICLVILVHCNVHAAFAEHCNRNASLNPENQGKCGDTFLSF